MLSRRKKESQKHIDIGLSLYQISDIKSAIKSVNSSFSHFVLLVSTFADQLYVAQNAYERQLELVCMRVKHFLESFDVDYL